MVHAQTGGVSKFPTLDAVGKPRFVHGRFKGGQRFCGQVYGYRNSVSIFVKGPLNGVAAVVILILLNWQDGFVVQGPLLFIVIWKGGDGVDALTSDRIVHTGLIVVGVLHVVLVVILQLKGSKGQGTHDDETPADQRELKRTLCTPLFSQFGEPDCGGSRNELNDQNGENEAGGGQSEHNNTEHTCKGGDRIDAVDETEVSQHVEEKSAETLDVRKRGFDFAQGHLG